MRGSRRFRAARRANPAPGAAPGADAPLTRAQPPLIDVPCTICRMASHEVAFTVNGHQILRCRRCRHLYVSPRPPMEEVEQIYGEHYFENPAMATTDDDRYYGYLDYIEDRPNIEMKMGEVLDHIEAGGCHGRLLDVGCGPGFFVDLAQRRGWQAEGIELNKYAVACAEGLGIAGVRAGVLSDVDRPDGFYDCVTLFDVIEHVADPRSEIEQVSRMLRPGGVIVIITPNADGKFSRLLGPRWLEMKRAPEHLHFFTVDSMVRLLSLGGFSSREWHTIGKTTTLRNFLTDMKFYGQRFWGGIEHALERLGWAEATLGIDPRTKMCVYARKTGPAVAVAAGAPDETVTNTPVRLRRPIFSVGRRGPKLSGGSPSVRRATGLERHDEDPTIVGEQAPPT
jgi:SAM-dependent methyltransferase